MRLAVACFVGALVLRIVMPFGIDETGAYVLLPTRMDTLAAGAFLALLIRGERGMAVLGRWPLVVFLACAVPLLLHCIRHQGIGYFQPIERTLGYTLFAGAFASMIALALTASPRHWLRRVFSGPMLTFLGKYSYGLYVVHVPIIFFMKDYGFKAARLPRLWDSTLPGAIVFGVVATALSVACALASYHLWEVRFLRLKKYLPYRNGTSREVAGQPQGAS
jgi:peptidoglycan/LPS O-acetylase OafA/YrhL